MRRHGFRVMMAVIAVVVGAGLLTGAGFAPTAAGAAARGSWSEAEKVPGLAGFFKDTHWTAEITSLACASPGNCGAGGYDDVVLGGNHALKKTQPFVVNQQNGRWGSATRVPGMAALNTGGGGEITSVACTRGGCAAGGYYTDADGLRHGFVVSQSHGRWGKAIQVPGLANLNVGGIAQVNSVSCPSAGNCAAGGSFTDSGGNVQAFVVNERNGRWRKATGVPGLAKMNLGGQAAVSSVRCASNGDCTAGGRYASSAAQNFYMCCHIFEAFVVSEHNGVWGAALEVPGIQAVNSGEFADISSVSCPSAGNCSAGGYYYDNSPDGPFIHGWVVSEKGGRWAKAVDMGGGLPSVGHGSVDSVSCPSAGNCVAAGETNNLGMSSNPAWVVAEKNFSWGRPTGIAGTTTEGGIFSVSCSSVGNCTAVGYYDTGGFVGHALLVTETRGRWGKPEPVRGLAALDKTAGGLVESVSCPSASKCTAAGRYDGPREGTYRPFVLSEVN